MKADIKFKDEIIEETAETILIRDGNGALLRRHKMHDATPEHVDFMVKDRTIWEEKIKPLLTPSRDRINFKEYQDTKRKATEKQRFFTWSGLNVFEAMHPVCGHEYMLMGMALDPDWIKDMVETYATLTVSLMEILFAEKDGRMGSGLVKTWDSSSIRSYLPTCTRSSSSLAIKKPLTSAIR